MPGEVSIGGGELVSPCLAVAHMGVMNQCQPQLDIGPGPNKLKKAAGDKRVRGTCLDLGLLVNLPKTQHDTRLPGFTWVLAETFPEGVCVIGSNWGLRAGETRPWNCRCYDHILSLYIPEEPRYLPFRLTVMGCSRKSWKGKKKEGGGGGKGLVLAAKTHLRDL